MKQANLENTLQAMTHFRPDVRLLPSCAIGSRHAMDDLDEYRITYRRFPVQHLSHLS
jgi:hypothetical protein